jgi:hypothetical protein
MKKILCALLVLGTLSAQASIVETIEIVKPMIKIQKARVDRNDWSGGSIEEAVTSGHFQSTFSSKQDCLDWTKNAVAILNSKNRTIYSAICTNEDLAPLWLNAGHFVGRVDYL